MSARHHLLALACAGVAACSGSPSSESADAAAPDAEPAVTAPAPPAPPVFTPCPPGWREVTDGDLTTCDPWPEGGALACAGDEAHFPGEPGCARVGPACPADGWPADLPAGKPVLWVRAGSAPGGNGTKASPFGTIYAAVTAATPGTVIAVATGLYEEGFTLDEPWLVLQGACVAGTRVAATVPSETAGTIHVTAPGVELRSLSLGGARIGLFVFPGGSVHVEDVVVDGAEFAGIAIAGGGLTARSLAVRDTRARPSDGRAGHGIVADDGAQVDVARAALERNRAVAIAAEDAGTTVVLSNVVVRDTRSRDSDLTGGVGLFALAGARVDVTHSAFERNRAVGVAALHPGTAVVLTGVVVRDTDSQESDLSDGRGLDAQLGARLEAARVTLERNRYTGAGASDEGTTMVLSDVVVRDTRSQESDLNAGAALGAHLAARVEVVRAVFERNRWVGVRASDEDTTVALSDVVVRDTASQESDGRYGRGLEVQDGARAEVSRAAFERNRDLSVMALDPGTTVRLDDVTIVDTLDQECRAAGTCAWSMTSHIGCYEDAAVAARRFELRRSAFLGVQLAPIPPELGGTGVGGAIDLSDGVVAENPIGINIQTVGFDLARIRQRVVWGPNQVNLVTDGLPVPDPSLPGGP